MSALSTELTQQLAQFSLLLGKWIPLTVFVAGILGSLHCTAMCGPLVLAATIPSPSPSDSGAAGQVPKGAGSTNAGLIAAYQIGRLLGYSVLGALAGSLGAGVFSGMAGTALSWISTALIAVAFGLLAWKAWRGEPPHLLPATLSQGPLRRLLGSRTLPPFARAGGVGLLSALLPCGWLHSFVLAAATTRSPQAGAVLLGVFWTGTLPALSLAPLLIRKLLNPLRRTAPRASAVLLLLAALASIGLQWAPRAIQQARLSSGAPQGQPIPGDPSCHTAAP